MNKLKKIRNRIYSAISSFMALTFLTMSVFAEGNIANSVIATGTKKLIADVSSWLTGIAIAVTAVVCVYLFIRRAMSDEQDKKQWDSVYGCKSRSSESKSVTGASGATPCRT